MDFSFSKQELETIYLAVDNLKDDTSDLLDEDILDYNEDKTSAQILYKTCNVILRKLKDFKI